MFASTKWQFFVFKHKMAAVVLSLNKTWLPWYDAENDWKRMREMENRREGEKEEKKEGFPASFISAVLPFTCYCKMKTCQKRNRIFLVYIFRKIAHFKKKNYTCVKAPN